MSQTYRAHERRLSNRSSNQSIVQSHHHAISLPFAQTFSTLPVSKNSSSSFLIRSMHSSFLYLLSSGHAQSSKMLLRAFSRSPSSLSRTSLVSCGTLSTSLHQCLLKLESWKGPRKAKKKQARNVDGFIQAQASYIAPSACRKTLSHATWHDVTSVRRR